MSTVSSATERALAPAVAAKGAALVECPVGGSTAPAREGKLFGFLGGSEADVARARPIVEQLCRRVEHVGPHRRGRRDEARDQSAARRVLADFRRGAVAGRSARPRPPQRLVDIFADTSGGPNMLKPLGPNIAQALGGDLAVGVFFDVDSVRKDLRTMLEEGRAQGKAHAARDEDAGPVRQGVRGRTGRAQLHDATAVPGSNTAGTHRVHETALLTLPVRSWLDGYGRIRAF